MFPMRQLDLNCDLGEGEPATRTRALMRLVSSVNVACGGHAGTARSMETCVRLAREHRVHLGAHPGLADPAGFGRAEQSVTPAGLELLLMQQVSALETVARSLHAPLHHIKLHGALYHLTEKDPSLSRIYLNVVARWWPRIVLFVRAGGPLAQRARRAGLKFWEEVFADRGYASDGSLLPRGAPGALLTDLAHVRDRLNRLTVTGEIVAKSGEVLQLKPRTVCIHSDTPDAVRLARAASNTLRRP